MFDGLDKVTLKNLIEYIVHAGAWAKNHESDSRLSKIEKLLESDEQLREFITKKTCQKKYGKLWAGSMWNIDEDSYEPDIGDTIRRENNPYHVWTRRKSYAMEKSCYPTSVDSPQTAGVIVRGNGKLDGEVLLDINGLHKYLKSLRKDPDSLRENLREILNEEYNSEHMYLIFNALRRLSTIKENFEVVTTSKYDLAEVTAHYSHNNGLFSEDGSWASNRITELL